MAKDEFQEMAGRFLDAWQEQLSASFRDPEAIARNMQTMQNYAKAYFENLQTARKEESRANTAASAHVPAGDDELRRLHERIETLERRITLLEIGKPKPRRTTRKGS